MLFQGWIAMYGSLKACIKKNIYISVMNSTNWTHQTDSFNLDITLLLMSIVGALKASICTCTLTHTCTHTNQAWFCLNRNANVNRAHSHLPNVSVAHTHTHTLLYYSIASCLSFWFFSFRMLCAGANHCLSNLLFYPM